jgi:iron complex outermembrane receptor protein
MSAKNHGSHAVRVAVAIALGTAALGASAPKVWAADADATVNKSATTEEAAPLEEVTVTGSRIRRKDLASTSPLVTIDSEQLEQRAGLNIESYLSELPQFNPALTPTNLGTNQDVQATPVNSVGIATISLRGFGANRSLVLIDGHRSTPINLQMVTDINSIPSAMIDRVEIITGGASAVYGADAIGGVTNFIMKKNYEGAAIDVQDSITQAGDGNETRVTALMGSKIANGRGNIVMGLEYYNRDAAYQKNRKFFTESFTDTGTSSTNGFFNGGGIASIFTGFAAPSAASISTIFQNRIAAGGSPYGFGGSSSFAFYGFNANGTVCQCSLNGVTGPYQTSNWTGPTTTGGYGLYNEYDPSQNPAGSPNIVQGVKRSDLTAYASSPQTRYSFFSNGNFDITDSIQFYTEARFEQSLTHTYLTAPPSVIGGWGAAIPFDETTDSPINPAMISAASTPAQLAAIYNAFEANPTTNAYTNPGYLGPAAAGAHHPVPWQMALLLDTRSFLGLGGPIGPAQANGGPVNCNNTIAASECPQAGDTASWELWWTPKTGLPPRNTIDTTQVWQIDTGFRFPLGVSDWTGDVYYSRGQSSDITHAYGNESLQRLETVLASPDYGAGQTFQGNQNNGAAGFGNGVPPTCSSGFYNSIFGGDVAPSADCQNAVFAITTSQTFIEQDNVQGNFSGTLFKAPAGDVSGAFGYEYRRDAGQFIPDTLNSTGSFLDQTLGLYPLGHMDNEISSRDGYLELLVPVVKDLPFLKALNLDLGGRYSSFDTGDNSTTFKINVDATLTNSLRIRGGYNRANRAPNIGELYLPTQQQFGGGALFNDPCSIRSNSPFGAAGPNADQSPSKGNPAAPLVNALGAAGAVSTYLICQAQMGVTAANNLGTSAAATNFYVTTSQAVPAGFSAFPDQQGNPNLKSETANTWTGGLVFAALSDSPWLAGLSGSIDWWQVRINNAIELDSGDYANFLCYGGNPVTTLAQAEAVAATQDCLNVARNPTNGAPASSLQVYTNQATIETAGIDVALNWISQLSDLGFKSLPGAISIQSQDTFLNYYRTKTSTAYFDPTINWKDSAGPTLAGTNGGAYGYRLNLGIGYILPSFGVNLNWRFLPSVNTATVAQNQAIIDYNNKLAAKGATTGFLSYSPNTTIATPAWYQFDLTANWNINKTFSIRAGINNLLDKQPPITGATTGFPVGTNLASVCPTGAHGCINPTTYSLPNDGAGLTNGSYYDLYGRTFFVGAKAQF